MISVISFIFQISLRAKKPHKTFKVWSPFLSCQKCLFFLVIEKYHIVLLFCFKVICQESQSTCKSWWILNISKWLIPTLPYETECIFVSFGKTVNAFLAVLAVNREASCLVFFLGQTYLLLRNRNSLASSLSNGSPHNEAITLLYTQSCFFKCFTYCERDGLLAWTAHKALLSMLPSYFHGV